MMLKLTGIRTIGIESNESDLSQISIHQDNDRITKLDKAVPFALYRQGVSEADKVLIWVGDAHSEGIAEWLGKDRCLRLGIRSSQNNNIEISINDYSIIEQIEVVIPLSFKFRFAHIHLQNNEINKFLKTIITIFNSAKQTNNPLELELAKHLYSGFVNFINRPSFTENELTQFAQKLTLDIKNGKYNEVKQLSEQCISLLSSIEEYSKSNFKSLSAHTGDHLQSPAIATSTADTSTPLTQSFSSSKTLPPKPPEKRSLDVSAIERQRVLLNYISMLQEIGRDESLTLNAKQKKAIEQYKNSIGNTRLTKESAKNFKLQLISLIKENSCLDYLIAENIKDETTASLFKPHIVTYADSQTLIADSKTTLPFYEIIKKIDDSVVAMKPKKE